MKIEEFPLLNFLFENTASKSVVEIAGCYLSFYQQIHNIAVMSKQQT